MQILHFRTCLTVSNLLHGPFHCFKMTNASLGLLCPRRTQVCFLTDYIYIYIYDFVFQKQSCQMLLNQLREITGIQEPSFLHEALKVGFSSRFSWQALKQFPHRCVRSGYLYTRPEHRKSPADQIRLVSSTEKLQEDGGNLQLGKPVGIHHPLYGSCVQPPNQRIFQQRNLPLFGYDGVILEHCWL